MPEISVIITSYNQQDTLQDAIDSVLRQTLPAREIIVCDDASTDFSREMIRSYESKYQDLVRGIFQNQNMGVASNRNSGFKLAEGEFVTWLDGDDIFLPRKLEFEASMLSNDVAARWIYSQVIEYNPKTKTRGLRYRKAHAGKIFEKVISVLGKAPRNPLVERSALKEVGFFDERLMLYEDFDLCLRLAKSFPCLYQAVPAMEYRSNPAGLSSRDTTHHWHNIQILHQNLLQYTRGMSETDKRLLENRFLTNEKVVYLYLKNKVDVNRKFESIRYLSWAFRHNRALITQWLLYRTLAGNLLPDGLKSCLKYYKETIFG